jgi:ABC-type amino acid transport substrate-binding protein
MDGLVQGGADAGVGAFSITAEREQMLDFSHPFYESGLQILVLSTGESSTFAAFAALFQPGTLIVLGLLVVALLVNSHILWWFERRKNAESFPEDYKQGMFEALWWNMSTLITAGCENKSPTGLIGRLAAIGWMIASIATVAYITATLSAALTVSTLTSDVRSVSDLIGKQVGTVAASAAEKSLKARGLDVRGYDSVEQACNALLNGEVKAVIYDQPLLRYFLATHPGIKLQLVGDVFERQDYGIPLRQNSPYRKAINTALLKLSEENYFVELNRKWFAGSSQ